MSDEQLFDEIDADDTIWRFERSFITSNWTCIWGRGCLGIGDTRDSVTGHGCCSTSSFRAPAPAVAAPIAAPWPAG